MLAINPVKVCYLIVKARQFDAKVEPVEPDPGSNASDDGMLDVLEDYPDDPVFEELKGFIDNLNEDEQVDLVALLWFGRDDGAVGEWPALRREAARARNEHSAEYLLGTPLLSDYLSEGLSRLGYNCNEEEALHL